MPRRDYITDYKQIYHPGTPLRDDIAHFVMTRNMARPPEMLVSGVAVTKDKKRIIYHDIRIYFETAPKP